MIVANQLLWIQFHWLNLQLILLKIHQPDMGKQHSLPYNLQPNMLLKILSIEIHQPKIQLKILSIEIDQF